MQRSCRKRHNKGVSTSTSDSDLLIRSRTSAEAFGHIYERHAQTVHGYLVRRAGLGPADDLLAEVFAATVEGRLRVRTHSSGSALPWLYGTAKNVVRAYLRARRDLFELPTDTKSMLSLLRGPAGRIDADRVAFQTVFELLSTSPAPRGARRALWLAAAELDGVSLIGRTNDAEGRQGWALTDGTSTYIVSPETGRLLESQYIAPDGAVSRTTILREGPTPTAPVVSSRSHSALEDPQ